MGLDGALIALEYCRASLNLRLMVTEALRLVLWCNVFHTLAKAVVIDAHIHNNYAYTDEPHQASNDFDSWNIG